MSHVHWENTFKALTFKYIKLLQQDDDFSHAHQY